MQDTKTGTYPFLTERIDNELRTGVAFSTKTGQFFEAVPEGEHKAPIHVRDPRTGKELTYDSRLTQAWQGECLGGMVFAQCNADRWAEFRSEYIDAPDDKHDEWERIWHEITD